MIFDPFRVRTILTSVPVAMPPAIDFDAFGVYRKPQNGPNSRAPVGDRRSQGIRES